MAELKQYKEQFDGLMNTLGLLERRNEVKADSSLPPWPGQEQILDLLKLMREFGKGQFLFFYHGFSQQRPAGFPKLDWHVTGGDPRIQYPPEHVLAAILDQISGDLATIQFCSEQRFLHYNVWSKNLKRKWGGSEDKKDALDALDEPGETKDAFEALDEFVYGSLWRAATTLDEVSDHKIVLTYFTDSPKVRVVPYANVALIGLPSSVLHHSRGLYSVAHEMGHFLFWHPFNQSRGKKVSSANAAVENTQSRNVRELFFPFRYGQPTDLASMSKENPPPWGEEIFADVYGALIGGPLYIEKAMDMAFERSTKLFLDVSLRDSHPMPLIRPLLMLKALVALNKPMPSGKRLFANISENVEVKAAQLLSDWEKRLENYGISDYRERTKTMVIWDVKSLDTDLLIEDLVDRAIQALDYVFVEEPSAEVLWGWSKTPEKRIEKTFEYFKEASNTLELLQMGADLLKQLSTLRPHEEGGPATPSRDEPEDLDKDCLPALWKDWVVDQKGYFDWAKDENGEVIVPTCTIWAGDFNTVMLPKTRPTNTWLPLFGAGGWITKGPCSNPGRP